MALARDPFLPTKAGHFRARLLREASAHSHKEDTDSRLAPLQ